MLDFNNFNDDEKTEFKPEPVLIENNKRFVLFPIQYNDIWQAYKSLESKFWTAEDVELSDDVQGFHDLQGKAKSHVLQCLSLVLVNSRHQNIPYQLSSEIQVPEARCFYGFEIMQTSIHQELAGLMMDQLTKDQQELRNDTVDLVATLPSLSRKMGWLQRYITDTTEHFSVKLVAYYISLSLFSHSLYDCMMHLDKLMPGLVHAVAKMKKDQLSFAQFCLTVKEHVVNIVSGEKMKKMVGEVVSIECDLIDELQELSAGVLAIGSTPMDFMKLKQRAVWRGEGVLKSLGLPIKVSQDPMPFVAQIYAKELKKDGGEEKIVKVSKSAVKQVEPVSLSFDADF